MKVRDLLLAGPWRGEAKTNRLMRDARISWGKTIGGMTVRQRGELIALVAGRPPCRKAAA